MIILNKIELFNVKKKKVQLCIGCETTTEICPEQGNIYINDFFLKTKNL